MDFLNSQHLTGQDGYLHVFRSPGRYEYQILTGVRGFEGSERVERFVIDVEEMDHTAGEGEQHDVSLQWDENARAFYPEPRQLTIGVNDFVLWHDETSMHGTPPYGIRGESKSGEQFDSRALGQHEVFTHMFVQPGSYTYQINEQGAGQIIVRDHRDVPSEAYAKDVADAPLVRIVGDRVEPTDVEIVAGQSVIWVVEEGDGITISTSGTDRVEEQSME